MCPLRHLHDQKQRTTRFHLQDMPAFSLGHFESDVLLKKRDVLTSEKKYKSSKKKQILVSMECLSRLKVENQGRAVSKRRNARATLIQNLRDKIY